LAHPKHAQVRQRFNGCCAYCGVSEVDVGGELTVDHYQPVAAGGDDSDDNLVYACHRCNLYKTDYVPDAEALARGERVLHPLRDQAALHYREDEQTGLLIPLTNTGRVHIMVLRLNRPPLVQHRLRRRVAQLEAERLRRAEALISEFRAALAEQQAYIAFLERRTCGAEESPEKETS
jgi:hypothetical protein